MTNTRKLTEVWEAEYAATRSIESAVAAVVTAVRAEVAAAGSTEIHVTVIHKHEPAFRQIPTDVLGMVVTLAARAFNVDVQSAAGRPRCRSTSHVAARWVAAAVFRRMGMSLPACARGAGFADHSTVHRALGQVEKRPDLQAVVAQIEATIRERGMDPTPDAIEAPTTTPSREVEAA